MDFTGGVQILTFAPGTTTFTVTMPTVADNIDEVMEQFTVQLINSQGAAVGVPDTATVDIMDNNSTLLNIIKHD